MADPLSATASAITVMLLCVQCTQKLQGLFRSIRDVPNELMALSNESNDLSMILEAVGDASDIVQKHSAINVRSIATLKQQLSRAESIVNELDTLIRRFEGKLLGKMQLERLAWPFKKAEVKDLQKRIKNVKLDLSNFLTTITL